jgi:DNA-binding NarL/FixJ family response regulator
MPGISLYVVSPHVFLCELLQHRLATMQSEISCAGTWHALEGMGDAIDRARPDVVMFDTALCDSKTAGTIRDCLKRRPDLKFLLLYDGDSLDTAVDCLAAGASACISKHCGFDKFLETVRAAASGESMLPSDLLASLVGRFRELRRSEEIAVKSALSDRDIAMLDMVVRGATNQEIADGLGLSHQTVKNSLTKLFCQLGVANRFQAAAWWRDHLMKA